MDTAPSNADTKRTYARAAIKIEQCWRNRRATVLSQDRTYGVLETLPPLPPHLTELKLNLCTSLTVLPELSGFARLKRVSCVMCFKLRTAPNLSGCSKLESVRLHDCGSLAAPPNFAGCARLQILDMAACGSLTVPPDLRDCVDLRILNLNGCASLPTPPDLSRCVKLQSLNLAACVRLTTPPDVSNCPDLQDLALNRCVTLTAPPVLSSHPALRTLFITDTPLTSLPENILEMPRACRIQINAASLSERVRNRLSAVVNAPGYEGVHIGFTMAEHAYPAAQPLHREVASWRAAAGREGHVAQSATHGDWKPFAAEPGAESFSYFLARLRTTSEYRSPALRKDFQRRINALLDDLQQPAPAGRESLRALCFSQAHDARQTCGDGIALILLDFETLAHTHQAETAVQEGRYDSDPAALAQLGLGMHRLDRLHRIARDKVKTLNFDEESEVRLGYLVQLSNEFALPVRMQTMLYPRCGNIREGDLSQARAQLHEDSHGLRGEQTLRSLSQWGPMLLLLERIRAQQIDAGGSAIPTHDDIRMETTALQQAIQEELGELDADAADYRDRVDALGKRFHAAEGDVSYSMRSKHILALLST